MSRKYHKIPAPLPQDKQPVAYDPLDCLVLWLVVLDGDEASKALEPLGIDADEIARLKRSNPELVERMRKLRMAGRLMVVGKLAMLARARIGEELMRCRDAKGIAALTTAMARMTTWMAFAPFGQEFFDAERARRERVLPPQDRPIGERFRQV